jgi:hypothetical protein
MKREIDIQPRFRNYHLMHSAGQVKPEALFEPSTIAGYAASPLLPSTAFYRKP